MDMYTLVFLEWITNKDLLCSAGNSVQCHVAAWMGWELGEERIHVYVWLSSPPESITALLIGYTSVQNKKFKQTNKTSPVSR